MTATYWRLRLVDACRRAVEFAKGHVFVNAAVLVLGSVIALKLDNSATLVGAVLSATVGLITLVALWVLVFLWQFGFASPRALWEAQNAEIMKLQAEVDKLRDANPPIPTVVLPLFIEECSELLGVYRKLDHDYERKEVRYPLNEASWPQFGGTWTYLDVTLYRRSRELSRFVDVAEGIWKRMQWLDDSRLFRSARAQSTEMVHLLADLEDFLHLLFKRLPNLAIEAATYGKGKDQLDVTGRLNSFITNDRLDLWINNKTMGGDPCYGVEKALSVTYWHKGQRSTIQMQEGGHLSLP